MVDSLCESSASAQTNLICRMLRYFLRIMNILKCTKKYTKKLYNHLPTETLIRDYTNTNSVNNYSTEN